MPIIPFPPAPRRCGPAAGNGPSSPDLPSISSSPRDNDPASQRASRADASPSGKEGIWEICNMVEQMYKMGLAPDEIGAMVTARIAELPPYRPDDEI